MYILISNDDKTTMTRKKQDMPRYIVDGFVFHVNIMKGKPAMMYLRCLEYKRLGCHARAIIPSNGTIQDIKVKKPHNHPPDYTAEEKIVFQRELREVLLRNSLVSIRDIYSTLSVIYPNAARELPFNVIRPKMHRWRRSIQGTSTSSQ
ncbi:hypothetical protein FQA39_LY07488 [Lamprigera yunnana]|nr:hypothetical protein FQA39_LY07488 [Lamprigera yunnana]